MSFLLAIAALAACGRALLALTRLATGRIAVDLPLAWFVGGGWFAAVTSALRFAAEIPYTALVAALVLGLPVLAAFFRAGLERSARRTRDRAPLHAERWRPRPLALFAPLAAYVALVCWVVVAHGTSTPTQTDDGLRLRAFTPLLAFDDTWGPEARALLPIAGAVPTWVPSLAWRLSGHVDAFDVNAWVVTGSLAFVALVVSLGSTRGRPEHAWAAAFAALSVPLFVYHATTTYTDAVLALHVGAGFAFLLESERTKDPADVARALLLLAVASLVKREGALVAAAAAGPLVLASLQRKGRRLPFVWWLVPALPVSLDMAGMVAAVGTVQAFPMLRLVGLSGGSGAGAGASPVPFSRVVPAMVAALFRSGNAGMLYWALAATVLFLLPALVRARRTVGLASVLALLALSAVSSVWLIPAFTMDGSTVHRALLVVSVPGALWLAYTLTDAARGGGDRTSDAPVSPSGAAPPLR